MSASFLAEGIAAHYTECGRPRFVKGLIVYFPRFFEWMRQTRGGTCITAWLRPLFAAKMLYCVNCGEMWICSGTAEIVLEVAEFFTRLMDGGDWTCSRTFFLNDLTKADRERLEKTGAIAEDEGN